MESLMQYSRNHHDWSHSVRSKTYFIRKAAARTGFSMADLTEVYNCFEDIILECIDDVIENPGTVYRYGPFYIKARKVGKRTWSNPLTKQEYSVEDHYVPTIVLSEPYKRKYSYSNIKKRELQKQVDEALGVSGTEENDG